MDGKQTKAVIGQTLITLCETKEVNKISVQEIAEKAQVNRQTFYYHFPDKKALIQWIYRQDALIFLTTEDVSLDNWEEAALRMLKAMTKQDILFYSRFFSYGCGGILENWIHNDFPETPLEIATQLFRLAKDVEFFGHQIYEKEEQ